MTAIQVRAAERIYARYSLLERSISVRSLEVYAREGRYIDNLDTYGRFFKEEQLQDIREGLLAPVELEALTIARALRAALILASAEPEGLTALNVLKKYPTQGLQVDLKAGLELFEEAQKLVQQTQQAVKAIETAAATQPAPARPSFRSRWPPGQPR